MSGKRASFRLPFVLLAALLLSGCGAAIRWVGIQVLYEKAELPTDRVLRDLPYWQGKEFDGKKHRLDLFLATGKGWPTVIFVHGGGWNKGDKGLRVGGRDVYGNIGRFFAAHGVGAAVINYRLLSKATWRQQIADVARAVAWVHRNVGRYGGDSEALFLVGHSAGAHLAASVALHREPLAAEGLGLKAICGLIAVSGVYDMVDPQTFALGAKLSYLEKRFKEGDPTSAWRRAASPLFDLDPGAPPVLLLYASGEWPWLQRQSQLLHTALEAAGLPGRMIEVQADNHARLALDLSRQDRTVGAESLAFIAAHPCDTTH